MTWRSRSSTSTSGSERCAAEVKVNPRESSELSGKSINTREKLNMATLTDMAEHCNGCGEPLEIGQIGACDSCQVETKGVTGSPVAWPNQPVCPNCGSLVSDHPENGCLLATLMSVLRERGTHEPGQIERIHARCDVDRMWQEVGELVDRLGEGAFELNEHPSTSLDGGL